MKTQSACVEAPERGMISAAHLGWGSPSIADHTFFRVGRRDECIDCAGSDIARKHFDTVAFLSSGLGPGLPPVLIRTLYNQLLSRLRILRGLEGSIFGSRTTENDAKNKSR